MVRLLIRTRDPGDDVDRRRSGTAREGKRSLEILRRGLSRRERNIGANEVDTVRTCGRLT